ncbi:porin [Loktanella sp. F6476L]|uniref:porin n=1 Tax=Loktanella sp. F6476L TaxID=2926405 RepID=UPI001FF57BE9|nr:porin [Loktanella sp. F6476L]MCK0120385.1 porin [Loktanella sp. F6476L]
MKSILLTSTALVAFAGAAAADGHASVSHSLGGTLGYNNEVDGIGEDGFFWEGNLKTTATAALDNGLTAGAYFEVTVAEDNDAASEDGGQALASSDFVLSLESDTASLFVGDTGTAATKRFVAAGDMESDAFTTGTDSAVLRGDVSFGGVDASLSYIIDDANGEAEQLSFGAAATFGIATLTAAYQEDTTFADGNGDFSAAEVMGVSAAVTVANATITLAYADNMTADTQSTGIKVSYPIGPVVATGYYVDEGDADANLGVNVAYTSGPIAASVDYQDDQGVTKYKVEGSYDLGNGLTVLAGALNENEGDDVDYYAGATYDLGGGATATFVYAADEDGDQGDEIGAGEYDPGVTVSVDFTF